MPLFLPGRFMSLNWCWCFVFVLNYDSHPIIMPPCWRHVHSCMGGDDRIFSFLFHNSKKNIWAREDSGRKLHQRSLFQCFIRSPQLFPMSCNCFWPALKFEVKSRLGICTESGGFVASSTRIRLLLNPQLFIFGFKSFPVHVAYSNGIRLFTRNFGETLDTTISAKSRRRISDFFFCLYVFSTLWRAD